MVTCVSSTYFGLGRDDPQLASLYISLILFCAAGTIWVVLDPKMHGKKAAPIR